MHVVLRHQPRPIGRDGHAGGNLHAFLAAVDDDAAEFRVVADVQVERRVDRDKEADVAVQRDLESRKGQHVPPVAVRNSGANLEVHGWCGSKVCLGLAGAGNLTVWLQ